MKIRLNGEMLALCCAVGMAVSPACLAQTLNQFVGTGDWSDTNKWTLLHLPDTTEVARISGSATLTNTPPAVAELRVYDALAVSGAETWLTANKATVGYNGGIAVTGRLTQVDGRFTCNGDFIIGNLGSGEPWITSGVASFTGTQVEMPGSKTLSIGCDISPNRSGTYLHRGGSLTCGNIAIGAGGSLGRADFAGLNTLTCGNITIGAGGALGSADFDGINASASSLIVGDSGLGMCQMTGTVFSTSSVTVGKTNNAVGTCGRLVMHNSYLGRTSTSGVTLGNFFGTTGILSMCGGAITGSVSIGSYGHGVFSNTAGRVYGNNFLVAASGETSSGYAYLGPGSYTESTVNAQAGRYGNGTIDVYGTFVTTNGSEIYVGQKASATGVMNLYPGGVILSRRILVGYSGTGTFHIAGGVAKILTAGNFPMGSSAGSLATVTLSGGRLETHNVTPGAGTEIFHFDGGTLATSASRTDFMGNLTTVDVLSGGAKIEVNHPATMAQTITHDVTDPAGADKDGGLFKDGAETLTMTGTLSFNGDLRVEAGTLNLAGATYTPGAEAGLGGGGTLIPKNGAFTVNGAVAPGTTNGTGTLTVQGALTVNGETLITVSGDGETCGALNVTGPLAFGAGSTLSFANPGVLKKKTSYIFATGGTLTGVPEVTNLPPAWTLKADNNTLRAVYHAGTLIRML
ncbi:MAG: hypothetical protein PHV28_14220 [Kiritimatiellae bacterium]|nr:hypothetical protein [Kiritimatiellia bacterium]